MQEDQLDEPLEYDDDWIEPFCIFHDDGSGDTQSIIEAAVSWATGSGRLNAAQISNQAEAVQVVATYAQYYKGLAMSKLPSKQFKCGSSTHDPTAWNEASAGMLMTQFTLGGPLQTPLNVKYAQGNLTAETLVFLPSDDVAELKAAFLQAGLVAEGATGARSWVGAA